MNFSIVDQSEFFIFWLIFSRWLIIFSLMPFFDEINVFGTLRVLFSFSVTVAMFAYEKNAYQMINFNESNLYLIFFSEIILSLVMIFIFKIILSIVMGAAALITQQIGLNAVRSFDPSSGQQVGSLEKLFNIVFVGAILMSGIWGPFMKTIHLSFYRFNFQAISNLLDKPELVLDFVNSIFVSSLILALPYVLITFFINVGMGILAKTIPQINLLMVSFIINIGIGFLLVYSTYFEFSSVAFNKFNSYFNDWIHFIAG